MNLIEFIERNPEIKGIHVSADDRWFDGPRKGFEYKTREEILGTVAEPEISEEIKTVKKTKNKK